MITNFECGGVESRHARTRRDGTGRVNPAMGFLDGAKVSKRDTADCTDSGRRSDRPALISDIYKTGITSPRQSANRPAIEKRKAVGMLPTQHAATGTFAVLDLSSPGTSDHVEGGSITQTEQTRLSALLAVANGGKAPKGLGTDGNKPLMRNRARRDCASAAGDTASNTLPPGLVESSTGNNQARALLDGEARRRNFHGLN